MGRKQAHQIPMKMFPGKLNEAATNIISSGAVDGQRMEGIRMNLKNNLKQCKRAMMGGKIRTLTNDLAHGSTFKFISTNIYREPTTHAEGSVQVACSMY